MSEIEASQGENTPASLDWYKDVRLYFPDCLRVLGTYWFLVVFVIIAELLSHCKPDTAMAYHLASLVNVLATVPISFTTIKAVWQRIAPAEVAGSLTLTPAMFGRLVLLNLVFVAVSLPIGLFYFLATHLLAGRPIEPEKGLVGVQLAMISVSLTLSVPLLWWGIKSSLATVLLCVENAGFWQSILRSHKMLDGRFWSLCKYLVPAFVAIQLPAATISMLASDWIDAALEQKAPDQNLVLASSAAMVVATIIWWVVSVAADYPLLVRFYSTIRDPKR